MKKKGFLRSLFFLIFFVCLLVFVSCQKKEILLPKAEGTIVADVQNHSPIYFFFKTADKDTLIEINRKNSISTTNWLFNIDKRLPLKLVIPEIKKLQIKKGESVHKNEVSENYFTYTDTITKSMAFLPFTEVKYKFEKPDVWIKTVFFDHNDLVKYEDFVFSKKELSVFLRDSLKGNPDFIFTFDKKMSFESYIQNKFLIRDLVKQGLCQDKKEEYVY